jgi:hypothetical protein
MTGRLRFCVYDETEVAAVQRAPKRRRRGNPWDELPGAPLTAEFYLLDSWRHDIVGKFRTRLQQAIAKLDPNSRASDRRNE